MSSYEIFIREFEEIRPNQIKYLEKYHGYDNLPRILKKDFDEVQQALLQLLKQI